MKIILFDLEFKKIEEFKNVEIQSRGVDFVIWGDGSLYGIGGYYAVVPDEVNELTPEEILNQKHLQILEKKKEETSLRIYEGFEFEGHLYSYKETDQINMVSSLNKLLLNPNQENLQWTTEDCGELLHSRELFFKLFHSAEEFKSSCIADYRKFKEDLLEQKPTPIAPPEINQFTEN